MSKKDIVFCKGGGCTAKLGPGILSRVLERIPKKYDENLLIGFESSDDASVYKLTDDIAMVQTLDFFPPMVDDPYTFGKIAAADYTLSIPYNECFIRLNSAYGTQYERKRYVHLRRNDARRTLDAQGCAAKGIRRILRARPFSQYGSRQARERPVGSEHAHARYHFFDHRMC